MSRKSNTEKDKKMHAKTNLRNLHKRISLRKGVKRRTDGEVGGGGVRSSIGKNATNDDKTE